MLPVALENVGGKLLPHERLGGVPCCWRGEGLDEGEGEDLHPRAEDLDAGQDDEELDGEMRELKHHRGAFCTPLLLPVVEPVGDEAPADAYEALLGHDLLALGIRGRVRG